MKFAMYFHGGSGNRGCEAIARTTSAMLKSRFPDCPVTLYTESHEQDIKALLPDIDEINELSFEKASLAKSVSVKEKMFISAYSRLISQHKADEYYYGRLYKDYPLAEQDIFLSVGGDNYCYGESPSMAAMNKRLKKLGKKTVLWGCSLDKTCFRDYTKKDLRIHDMIIARESFTYDLLKEHGFDKNVFLHADPAFTLETERLPFADERFEPGNVIGLNLSPLVLKSEPDENKGVGMRSYERLIEYILRETDSYIALTPHVFWQNTNDMEPLTELYEKYRHTGRLLLIGKGYNAMQLKGFISRMKVFVGARTHATIAAYSSCVPTLVLGYSIKALGIAHDIFGTTEGLVLPIDLIDDEFRLTKAFEQILQNHGAYQSRLTEFMPGYIQSARDAAARLDLLM